MKKLDNLISSVHGVMRNQAGDRLVITCKIKDRCIITSHYKDLKECLLEHRSLGRNVDWYSINGGDKISLK